MSFVIRPMSIEDYEQAYALWEKTEGIGLSDADKKENIQMYLDRNPELSFVALSKDKIIGTVLSGHDGRRGFIHHLVVDMDRQRQGIGEKLVKKCLETLKQKNIQKCHIFVYRDNVSGKDFWKHIGWKLRKDLDILSFDI